MMKLTLRSVRTRHCTTLFGDDGLSWLGRMLAEERRRNRKVFILADANTEKYCLPRLTDALSGWEPDGLIVMPAGEENKTIATAAMVWRQLADGDTDRQSLLLNLGGGVVTDLGGFTASCFKRGIRFINIPTTLIGMADAAIGGKTGVDLDGLKNQTGTFTLPEAVVIWTDFLETLDGSHLISGMAEVAKTALVADKQLWRALSSCGLSEQVKKPGEDPSWNRLIRQVAVIKNRIVALDFEERDRRKLLNFGHTVGHAFESLMLRKGTPVPHGEAVAMGMICETYLSAALTGLPEADLASVTRWLTQGFGKHPLAEEDRTDLLTLMQHDKKNRGGVIRITGISEPGIGKTDIAVSGEQFLSSFRFYNEEV